MARGEYGGTMADTIFGRGIGGTARFSSATVTGWTAKIGGSQHTDFLLNGASVAEIPVGDDGQFPVVLFPDSVMSMWLSADGGPRVLARAVPPPITVSSTAPASPAVGQVWIDTSS